MDVHRKTTASSLFLLSIFHDRKIMGRARAKGAVCLKEHSIVAGVLEAYGIPWQGDDALEDLAFGEERIVASPLRNAALPVTFSSGVWTRDCLRFEVAGREPLVLDFSRRVVRGPWGEAETAEIPFDRLTAANVDEREVHGDTKFHRFFYLHLCDGQTSLVYYQHMREYFERCAGLREMESAQRRSELVIHAIPAALGVANPRLARPDLANQGSLCQLLWSPLVLFLAALLPYLSPDTVSDLLSI